MRSALTENLRGGATPGPLLLVLVLIAAVLAVPSPALAANVSFSIPTKVELKIKADGTVIAPSADAWQIRNLGDEPIQLTSIGSVGFGDGETVAANSGTWSLSVNGAASQSGTMTIQPASQTGITWSVPTLGALGAIISSKPYTAGSISFGFQAVDDLDPDPNGTAFAVYSADDNSLDFYKRDGTPHVGHLFNGKTATEVYTDIEDYDYQMHDPAQGEAAIMSNIPWWSHRHDVKSVKVVDCIRPKSMCAWFFYFTECATMDLEPIDTSECTDLYATFDRCVSLTTLDVSMFDTSRVIRMSCTFFGDKGLESLDLTNWDISSVAVMSNCFRTCAGLKALALTPPSQFKAGYWAGTFMDCPNLVFDCSKWNVNESDDHTNFAHNAPGVILPKAWQASTNNLASDGSARIDAAKIDSVVTEAVPAVSEPASGAGARDGSKMGEEEQSEHSGSIREATEEQPAEAKNAVSDQLVQK